MEKELESLLVKEKSLCKTYVEKIQIVETNVNILKHK
jgi:hypothetical protein